MTSGQRRLSAVATAAVVVALSAACGGTNTTPPAGEGTTAATQAAGAELTGQVKIDGSSTVAPLTSAAAEFFAEEQPKINVTVGTSGTGGGFEKFCNGETDVADASRPIKDEEKAACDAKGIKHSQLSVATDALTVVVNKENTWATCLTTDQLRKMWEPAAEGKVTTWKQVDAKFPDEPLKLFGPGTDSGTFDYFTDEINGEEGASRKDYSPSEDDNITVQGVTGSKGGLGYFGFTYFEENADKLKAVEIDSGEGCVAPSVETAQNGTYAPLSRALFVYPSATAAKRPEVAAFLDFFVANINKIATDAQFVPLNAEQEAKLKTDFAALKTQAG
ncbi:PstS family phosphate ABC transporter substrate-binding protein [Nonomuraea cavernae]|uniref:Phosphate-binding protein n=1 Tax=Nonomuraea cavernae TaxID=2045107 RepID=A0A917YPV0_9ACTN|nr:PstS family phosphate ABC transporter substrate-binding protein [Nonomuraea cavernae]MCA2183972.1 PstS family phosphate ABC transporter substrate-binding protein [Nonomuraea cavernae]GGO61940.1 phosphate ABC transporter substrate-binding protein [Nonomuraea cavernae]